MRNIRQIILPVFLVMMLFLLTGCSSANTDGPIQGFTGFMDLFVWPMAGLMYGLGKTIAFGNYALVIFFATIIVRTLAWPIYSKTNDLSLKMQLVGPEQAKLQAKYEGKTDPESKQRMQMEMMQLYKKFGIGIGGCLMPFVQMPIFLGFFSVIRRIPATSNIEGVPLDFGFLNHNILGVDLYADKGVIAWDNWQMWAVAILAILVSVTQIFSQILINKRQTKMREEMNANTPTYRMPEKTDQQKQSEKMMKFMIYGMTIMMAVFVWTSPAALGFYWLIGNTYSTVQSQIAYKKSSKRLETLKSRY